MGFLSRETFITCWSGGRVQVWVQVRALPLIWPGQSWSLFRKTNENFVCKINGPALGAALQQGLGRLDLQAQTQGPGCFLVDCSRRWQQLVRLRKQCYHSCYADLVWDSKRFQWFVNFGSDDDFFFFVWNEIFNRRFYYQVIPTKAALIASLNLSIIHWSLGKISSHEQAACCELNPVQYTRP